VLRSLASPGGEVGVDLPQGKNLVGAFYNPLFVVSDPSLLMSLPTRHFAAGMAEVIKAACIPSPELFEKLEAREPALGPQGLDEIVAHPDGVSLVYGIAPANRAPQRVIARVQPAPKPLVPPAGAAAAALIGALSIQGRGVYAVMLTFAFNEMAYFIAFEWRTVTGGDNGLRGIPRPDIFAWSLADPLAYYYFTAAVVLIALFCVRRILASPFGAVLRAIRENEARAKAIGFRVRRFKIAAFTLSGALAGLAGGLYALLFRFAPLQAIDFDTSTSIVVAAVLGGIGTFYGPLVGGAIYMILANSLSHYWAHWPLLLGIVFCVVVLFFRKGLLGTLGDALRTVTMKGRPVAASTRSR